MNLLTFDFNAAPLRVVMREEEPWFVAADVCRVLDLANPTDATKGLDQDETITLDNSEGNPRAGIPHQLRLISESGLYALVFKSRKPEAKTFRKWVTSEVLPAIRKTGRYEVPQTEGDVERISLLAFVRECCHGWGLALQTEFGLKVRRYAKAMGVMFETMHEPGIGRVLAFPRPILEHVRRMSRSTCALPDSDAVEFEKLLEALHRGEGDAQYLPEVARGVAKTMGLFPRIFGQHTSLESERSSFGRLCERFNGRVFPSGFCLHVRGVAERRRYEVNHTGQLLALTN